MTSPKPPSFESFAANLQKRIDDLVAAGSWLVVNVGPDPARTPPATGFAYTIGLTEHGLPELLIAGLLPDIGQAVLNELGRRMRSSGPFKAGNIVRDALQGGLPIAFVDIPDGALPIANARYEAAGYSAMQVFWPDEEGRLPWEAGANPSMAAPQQNLHGLGKSDPTRAIN